MKTIHGIRHYQKDEVAKSVDKMKTSELENLIGTWWKDDSGTISGVVIENGNTAQSFNLRKLGSGKIEVDGPDRLSLSPDGIWEAE